MSNRGKFQLRASGKQLPRIERSFSPHPSFGRSLSSETAKSSDDQNTGSDVILTSEGTVLYSDDDEVFSPSNNNNNNVEEINKSSQSGEKSGDYEPGRREHESAHSPGDTNRESLAVQSQENADASEEGIRTEPRTEATQIQKPDYREPESMGNQKSHSAGAQPPAVLLTNQSEYEERDPNLSSAAAVVDNSTNDQIQDLNQIPSDSDQQTDSLTDHDPGPPEQTATSLDPQDEAITSAEPVSESEPPEAVETPEDDVPPITTHSEKEDEPNVSTSSRNSESEIADTHPGVESSSKPMDLEQEISDISDEALVSNQLTDEDTNVPDESSVLVTQNPSEQELQSVETNDEEPTSLEPKEENDITSGQTADDDDEIVADEAREVQNQDTASRSDAGGSSEGPDDDEHTKPRQRLPSTMQAQILAFAFKSKSKESLMADDSEITEKQEEESDAKTDIADKDDAKPKLPHPLQAELLAFTFKNKTGKLSNDNEEQPSNGIDDKNPDDTRSEGSGEMVIDELNVSDGYSDDVVGDDLLIDEKDIAKTSTTRNHVQFETVAKDESSESFGTNPPIIEEDILETYNNENEQTELKSEENTNNDDTERVRENSLTESNQFTSVKDNDSIARLTDEDDVNQNNAALSESGRHVVMIHLGDDVDDPGEIIQTYQPRSGVTDSEHADVTEDTPQDPNYEPIMFLRQAYSTKSVPPFYSNAGDPDMAATNGDDKVAEKVTVALVQNGSLKANNAKGTEDQLDTKDVPKSPESTRNDPGVTETAHIYNQRLPFYTSNQSASATLFGLKNQNMNMVNKGFTPVIRGKSKFVKDDIDGDILRGSGSSSKTQTMSSVYSATAAHAYRETREIETMSAPMSTIPDRQDKHLKTADIIMKMPPQFRYYASLNRDLRAPPVSPASEGAPKKPRRFHHFKGFKKRQSAKVDLVDRFNPNDLVNFSLKNNRRQLFRSEYY